MRLGVKVDILGNKQSARNLADQTLDYIILTHIRTCLRPTSPDDQLYGDQLSPRLHQHICHYYSKQSVAMVVSNKK